jgi:hypothetical protein
VFFEGADGDVAVLPKPLILNPAGTEGQILINALLVINAPIVGNAEVIIGAKTGALSLVIASV